MEVNSLNAAFRNTDFYHLEVFLSFDIRRGPKIRKRTNKVRNHTAGKSALNPKYESCMYIHNQTDMDLHVGK